MRAGDQPDFPYATLNFTEAEYADLLYLADLEGIDVAEFIKDAALEQLRRRFETSAHSSNVVPFKKRGTDE